MPPAALSRRTDLRDARLASRRLFGYVSFSSTFTQYTSPMSQKTDANQILPPERFAGDIALDGHQIPIRLTASAGPSGRLELAVDPIPAESPSVAFGLLMRSLGRPGGVIDEFALECADSAGRRITSNCAYLAGYNHNSKGLNIELRTREATLTMTAASAHQRPLLQFRLLGFACFPAVHVPSTIGSLTLHGATRAAATNAITGYLAAEAADTCDSATWRASAVHMLTHIRTVLAFARGAPLPVPVTEYYCGPDTEVTFHERGAGSAPMMPPFSHLDLKPIVTAAVTNIENVEHCRDAFELAVGWLSVPTAIDEIRFLSGMTALESVAWRSLPSSKTSILSRSKSDKFARHIRAVVDEQRYIDDPDREAIKQKIPELNRRSFIQQIEALLEHWNVSRSSIETETLVELIKLRNNIAHRGAAAEDESLWPSILLIREIVVRLVLSMLRFEGTYRCYLGGRHTRRFPDCKPVD